MAKKLIINADDLGVSDDINKGIVECIVKGAVTRASILAAGDYFDDAAVLLRKNNLKKAGAHLALTGGFRPLSRAEKIKTLVTREGVFEKNFPALILKCILGKVDQGHIYSELKAQIDRIKNAGVEVSHIDCHEHIHMFPLILRQVVRLAREYNVAYIRFPYERVPLKDMIVEPANVFRLLCLRSACYFSKGILKRSGIGYNDYFFGQFHAHNLTAKDFSRFLKTAKDGTNEIGCHPGYFGSNISKTRPWYKSCEEEMKVLTSKEFLGEIRDYKIELVK